MGCQTLMALLREREGERERGGGGGWKGEKEREGERGGCGEEVRWSNIQTVNVDEQRDEIRCRREGNNGRETE